MNQKKIPGTPTVSPAERKGSNDHTATPPTPKEVTEKIESQRAAKPGHGPKNKGSIG